MRYIFELLTVLKKLTMQFLFFLYFVFQFFYFHAKLRYRVCHYLSLKYLYFYMIMFTINQQFLSYKHNYNILKLPMKYLSVILSIALVFSINFINVSAKNKQQKQTVHLQYTVHPENDGEHQMMKIQLQVNFKDSSLQNAQQNMDEVTKNIIEVVKSYCQEYIQSGFNCLDNLSQDDIQFSAFYRTIKGRQIFEYFQINQGFEIIITNQGNFGELVDQLQEISQVKVMKVQWEEVEGETDEMLLEKGKQTAINMCENLGMRLKRISSVELVLPEKEQPKEEEPEKEEGEQEEEEQQQQEDQQQEPEASSEESDKAYHFKADCISVDDQKIIEE